MSGPRLESLGASRDAASCLDPVHAGHPNVHQDHVRFEFGGGAD